MTRRRRESSGGGCLIGQRLCGLEQQEPNYRGREARQRGRKRTTAAFNRQRDCVQENFPWQRSLNIVGGSNVKVRCSTYIKTSCWYKYPKKKIATKKSWKHSLCSFFFFSPTEELGRKWAHCKWKPFVPMTPAGVELLFDAPNRRRAIKHGIPGSWKNVRRWGWKAHVRPCVNHIRWRITR